jgi:flagellar protein FliO/FliZ
VRLARLAPAAVGAAAALALAGPAQAVTDADLRSGIESHGGSGSAVPSVSLGSGDSLLRSVLGVVLVVGVILVVAKLLRANQRRQLRGTGADGLIEVVGTTPIGPNRNIHLLRVGGELLLIGAGEGSITPLRSFSAGEAAALGVLAHDDATDLALAPASALALPAPAPAARPRRRGMVDTLRELSAR